MQQRSRSGTFNQAVAIHIHDGIDGLRRAGKRQIYILHFTCNENICIETKHANIILQKLVVITFVQYGQLHAANNGRAGQLRERICIHRTHDDSQHLIQRLLRSKCLDTMSCSHYMTLVDECTGAHVCIAIVGELDGQCMRKLPIVGHGTKGNVTLLLLLHFPGVVVLVPVGITAEWSPGRGTLDRGTPTRSRCTSNFAVSIDLGWNRFNTLW